MIHLDTNACTGLLPEVKEELMKLLERMPFNPSSVHQEGQRARAILEEAREKVSRLLDSGSDDRVIFTSGATEANNYVLQVPKNARQIITTAVEHPSVLEVLPALEKQGGKSIVAAYPLEGSSWEEEVLKHVTPETSLVSCMLVNNETGEILPVQKIAEKVRSLAPAALIHTDGVQGAGKIPVSFKELGVDYFSLSGHKIGALTGIGALIISSRVPHVPLLHGGPQETRWRAGTENVAGIASLGYACDLVRKKMFEWQKITLKQSESLIRGLKAGLPGIEILNENLPRVQTTLSVRFPDIRADDLVVALDLRGVAVSSGSACASGKQLPSHVLTAMGYSESRVRETVRISFWRPLDETALNTAISQIVETVLSMKAVSGCMNR